MASRWLTTAVLALLTPPASGWVTTSQARFGLTIAQIQNEWQGNGEGLPLYSLGYLWNQPASTGRSDGIGGSITWQWDERLCDTLRMDENFWGIGLVSCDSLKASMHRAFDTWSQNSRHIKFTDVSSQCDQAGYARERCPMAEIFVTNFEGLNHTDVDHTDATGIGPPIISMQSPTHTTDFRYTNGQFAERSLNNQISRRRVTAVIGGTLAFRTQGVCWYLDSEFCAGYHYWKRVWESPEAAYAVGVTVLLTLWLSMVCFVGCQFGFGVYGALRKYEKDKDKEDYDAPPNTLSPAVEKWSTMILSFSTMSMALRFFLLIGVWPIYSAVRHACR